MIIVSNGFNGLHLAVTAAEMRRRGMLSRFLTGTYPTPMVQHPLTGSMLARNLKPRRLLASGEDISASLVTAMRGPETLYQLMREMRRWLSLQSLASRLQTFAFRFYGRWATAPVERSTRDGARLYHYHAGFGHELARVAKTLSLVTLCDYSIAHPTALTFLVENHGCMLPSGCLIPFSRIWADILADPEQGLSLKTRFTAHWCQRVMWMHWRKRSVKPYGIAIDLVQLESVMLN